MAEAPENCDRCGRSLAGQRANQGTNLFPTRRILLCDGCYRHTGMIPGTKVNIQGIVSVLVVTISLLSMWRFTGDGIWLLPFPIGILGGAALLIYLRLKLGR